MYQKVPECVVRLEVGGYVVGHEHFAQLFRDSVDIGQYQRVLPLPVTTKALNVQLTPEVKKRNLPCGTALCQVLLYVKYLVVIGYLV